MSNTEATRDKIHRGKLPRRVVAAKLFETMSRREIIGVALAGADYADERDALVRRIFGKAQEIESHRTALFAAIELASKMLERAGLSFLDFEEREKSIRLARQHLKALVDAGCRPAELPEIKSDTVSDFPKREV